MRAGSNLRSAAIAALALVVGGALAGVQAESRTDGAPLAGVLDPAASPFSEDGMTPGADALQQLFAAANDGAGDQHCPSCWPA